MDTTKRRILIVGPVHVDFYQQIDKSLFEVEFALKPSPNVEQKFLVKELRNDSVQILLTELNLKKLINYAHNKSFDGIFSLSESHIPTVQALADKLGLSCSSHISILKATDKAHMRAAFLRHDPTINAKFKVVSKLETCNEFAGQYGFPVVLKPANLAKSLLVSVCNDKHQLEVAWLQATSQLQKLYKKYNVSTRPKLLIEEYLHGKQHSINMLINSDGSAKLLPIADHMTAQEAGYDDSFLFSRVLPTKLTLHQQKKVEAAAISGIKALGLRSTAAHVEIIYTKNGPKIIEIGARAGGYRTRMYKDAYNYDYTNDLMRICCGEKIAIDFRLKQHAFVAVFEVFPHSKGTLKTINIPKSLQTNSQVKYMQSYKKINKSLVGRANQGFKACLIVYLVCQSSTELEFLTKETQKIQIVVM